MGPWIPAFAGTTGEGARLVASLLVPMGTGSLALDCRRMAGGDGLMMDYGGRGRKRFLSWVLGA